MIKFDNISSAKPYEVFKKNYDLALEKEQKNIEAISISSFSKKQNLVNSRFVNLKIVNNAEFIFFTNYNSPKSIEFNEHNQITALIYWNSINIQIRMKALIERKSNDFNNKYFSERNKEKNAIAISSDQSQVIASYEQVKENYNKTLHNDNLEKCPEYWGGFGFMPFYFEFWKGHKSRINKRDVFELVKNTWHHSTLQP